MARNYERAARMKLVRVNLLRAGIEVKGPKGMQQGSASMHIPDMRGAGGRLQSFLERFPSS
jgi:COP9 signalosome complex subunit 1